MDSSKVFDFVENSFKVFGFVEILKQAFKIFFRNGKIMASITMLTLLLYSSLYVSNMFSIKPSITDLFIKQGSLLVTSPSSFEFVNLLADIKQDFKVLIGLQSTFFFAYFIVSFLSALATILASSMIHRGKNLSPKELVSMMVRSWIRLLVTGFYTSLFSVGYTCLVMAILPTLVLFLYRPIILYIFWHVIALLTVIFSIYLSVIWTLSLVVSVLDETCYGVEALGKAAKLVKGQKLHGFTLSFLSTIVTIVVIQILRLITIRQSSAVHVVIGLLIINSICLVNTFMIASYTVLYYHCKKTHGEEVELKGITEYSKIPDFPQFVSENLP